ncbi:hypothetical protein [Nocardia brasiliensis]|uniref:hypothetical protein n=1 Tax=Nocardia brasiliensis TaxID=37326 RepID=UPI0033D2901B
MAAPATKLLKDLEPLAAPQRRRAIAGTALRLRGTPELGALLSDLGARGHYERVLAGQLATIAADRAHLLAQLDSAEAEFGCRALAGLVRVGVAPAELVARVSRFPHRVRRTLYRAIGRRSAGPDLADALLPEIRTHFGDAEAAHILPYCSAAVVAEYLPRLDYATPNWRTLQRKHSDLVLGHLEGLAALAGEAEWPHLWPWIAAGADTCALHHPDRLLALAARAVRYVPLAGLHRTVGALARHDVDAVGALILHPSGRGTGLTGRALFTALRELPDERLIALCAAYPDHQRRALLRTLAPARRAAVIQVFIRPGTDPARVDLDALDQVPRDERTALVRLLLTKHGGTEVRAVRERLIARLPWDEAEPALRESIRRPTAEERAQAYPLLVTAAIGSRDPEAVGALLDLLRRLRNEQDPVRRIALQAIGRIPPTLLRGAHLPALEMLTADAVQARDRSSATIDAVGRIARTLLVHGARTGETAFAGAALRIIESLAAQESSVPLWQLHRDLPHGAEHRLFDTLRPRLDSAAARDEWDLTLRLTQGLDRRAWQVPALQQLLLRACGARDDHVIRTAVDLVLANPATRDEHLAVLLHRDRSLIALPRVRQLIATRRTDLLGLVLAGANPGRFSSPKVRMVPDFSTGFGGWTPRQVELYARALTALARSKQTAPWEKAWAIQRLGRLPESVARLCEYLDDPELTVAEAALTALGRSDPAAAAIDVLGRYVTGDRARVAVSGMASRAGSIAPDQLAVALRPLLDAPKVTSVKEGVRLLAALHAPEAMATLRALWDRPGQHRDVRRAIVFGCRWLLGHDEAWQILDAAVRLPEVASEVLALTPGDLPVAQRHRMAELVHTVAADPDTALAGTALRVLGTWHRWAPGDTGDLLVRRLTDLSEVGLWRQVVPVLVHGGFHARVPAAVDRLLASAGVVLSDRDLPARQRLSTLLDALATAAESSEQARTTAATVAARLAHEPGWQRAAIDLRLTRIQWAEADSGVLAIRQACAHAQGALLTYPAQRLRARLAAAPNVVDADTMAAVVRAVSADSTAAALCALTLISQCGSHFGWSADWVELLARMRTHEQEDVRFAAHEVFTVAE